MAQSITQDSTFVQSYSSERKLCDTKPECHRCKCAVLEHFGKQMSRKKAYTFRSNASYTRQANTTTYGIEEVLSTTVSVPLKMQDVSKDNGTPFWITKAYVTFSTIQTIAPQIHVFLFRKPISIAADNTAFAPTNQDLAEYIDQISMYDTTKFAATTLVWDSGMIPRFCVPDPNEDSIWAVLTTLNAYVPASGEVPTLTLVGTDKL